MTSRAHFKSLARASSIIFFFFNPLSDFKLSKSLEPFDFQYRPEDPLDAFEPLPGAWARKAEEDGTDRFLTGFWRTPSSHSDSIHVSF